MVVGGRCGDGCNVVANMHNSDEVALYFSSLHPNLELENDYNLNIKVQLRFFFLQHVRTSFIKHYTPLSGLVFVDK